MIVTLLTSGYSGSLIYKIKIHQKYYILKTGLINARHYIKCFKQASKAGLAPRYYYANAKTGIIFMDYIENEYTKNMPPQNKKLFLKQLAQALQQLHDLTLFPRLSQDVFQYMYTHVKKIPNTTPIGISRQKLMDNLNVLSTLKTKKSCHNDLNPKNIIFNNNKIYFIDWETAGADNPYYDIATVIDQFKLTTSEQHYFLKHYFTHSTKNTITPALLTTLNLMQEISRACYKIYFYLLAHPHTP